MSYEQFKEECQQEILVQSDSNEFQLLSNKWINKAQALKYSYHFEWLGRPIIQYPQDIIAMQEIIFSVKPDLIIETGIAHGGSLIFYASMLELSALCGGPQDAEVFGIDIDIRDHNREAIEVHPMSKRITMIQGSSIAADIISQVKTAAANKRNVLVCLDSNHTHDHVLAELEAYAPLTSIGSYCVVFDTVIEDMDVELFSDRPWRRNNNPKTAVRKYLKIHSEFVIDTQMNHKLQVSVAPDGYLKRIR